MIEKYGWGFNKVEENIELNTNSKPEAIGSIFVLCCSREVTATV
jgi:hypothetical protein